MRVQVVRFARTAGPASVRQRATGAAAACQAAHNGVRKSAGAHESPATNKSGEFGTGEGARGQNGNRRRRRLRSRIVIIVAQPSSIN